MAITVRKGFESQFDINKMLPGEFAVTTDTHKVYVCMAAGASKELASVEELQNILGASEEAFQAFQELLNAMESDSVITGLLSDINSIKSGEYTISFSEAEERSNIESTDTIKVILGKIKKFFSGLSSVAFSGKYTDLEEKPNFSTVATSGSYSDLSDKPTLGDAASKSVANNLTTSAAGTSVLDAYQGKLLKDQLDEQNTNCTKWVSFNPSVETELDYGGSTYLILAVHNSLDTLNGLWIYRPGSSKAYAIKDASAITISGNGHSITVTASSGTPSCHYMKI